MTKRLTPGERATLERRALRIKAHNAALDGAAARLEALRRAHLDPAAQMVLALARTAVADMRKVL